MKKSRLYGAVCACLSMLFALPIHAALVTINFSGQVSSVGSGLTSSITIGDSFSATLFYDTSAALGPYTSGSLTQYGFPSSPASFLLDVNLGTYTGSGQDGVINLVRQFNGSSQNWFQPLSGTNHSFLGDSVNGATWTQTTITLKDDDGVEFSGTDLPPSMPAISDLEEAFASMFFLLPDNTTTSVSAQIDTISVATVPIPAALWLFGSGLLGLVGIARRKKSA